MWQSPNVLDRFHGRYVCFPGGIETSGGFPHQAAAWFGMTHLYDPLYFKQQFSGLPAKAEYFAAAPQETPGRLAFHCMHKKEGSIFYMEPSFFSTVMTV